MTDAAAPASFRVGRVALVVAGAMFMQNLDSAIINTSLPQMAASFAVRPADLSLGITAYLLASAAFLPLASWIADRFGARRVFAGAIVWFTLASVACGMAQSLWQFALARVLQGIGGAMMAPVGKAVVLRQTSARDLVRAVALITWPALLAPVIAPVLGGFLTTYFSWRWNFLLNAPLGLVAILMVQWLVPPTPPEERRGFDSPGLLFTSGALLALLYGLENLAAARGSAPLNLAWIMAGLIAGAFALRHLRRAREPLLDLAPLQIQTFRLTTADAGLLFRATIAATPFMLPLLLQLGYGLTPLQAGGYLMIYFCGNVAMKPFTTRLMRTHGFRRILTFNGVLSGLTIASLAWPDLRELPLLVSALLFVAGLTRSMQFTCLNTLSFADVPDGGRGAAATLSSMLIQLATTAGIALAALLLQKLPLLHGGSGPAVADFRLAFLLVGALGVGSALAYGRLPHDAGNAVSGHQPAASD